MRTGCVFLKFAVLAFTAISVSRADPKYTVRDLNQSVSFFGPGDYSAAHINDNGDVAGSFVSADNKNIRAFLILNGKIIDLNPPEIKFSTGTAINNFGQAIINTSEQFHNQGKGEDHFKGLRCYLWQNNSFQEIMDIPSEASAINNMGQLAGKFYSFLPLRIKNEAFYLKNGNLRVLHDDGKDFYWSEVCGLNDSEEVVGYFMDENFNMSAFLWQDSRFETFETPGGYSSAAFGINNKSESVGYIYYTKTEGNITDYFYTAVLWKQGRMNNLWGGWAWGINDFSQIVGTVFADAPNYYKAGLWDNGKLYDLNSLISSDSGWYLSNALKINNRSQIVVSAKNSAGGLRGLILDPISETPTISAIVPSEGAPGIEVKIRGKNFTPYSYFNDVNFGGFVTFDDNRVQIKSWQNSQDLCEITVVAPTKYEPCLAKVKVWVGSGPLPGFLESNEALFTFKEPVVETMSPETGLVNDKVIIAGKYFGDGLILPSFIVKFGLSQASVEWSDNKLVCEAPSDYGSGINDAKMIIKLLSLATMPAGEAADIVIEQTIEELGKWIAEQLGEMIEVVTENDGQSKNIRQKITKTLKFDGVKVRIGDYRIDVDVKVRTPIGKSNAKTFSYQFDWASILEILSAGELRVYDSNGRITGTVDGQIRTEIPFSYCDGKKIFLVNPSDSYRYEVVGREEGVYGLKSTILRRGERPVSSVVYNIPIVSGEVHTYESDLQRIDQANYEAPTPSFEPVSVKNETDRNTVSDPAIKPAGCGFGICGLGLIEFFPFMLFGLRTFKFRRRLVK